MQVLRNIISLKLKKIHYYFSLNNPDDNECRYSICLDTQVGSKKSKCYTIQTNPWFLVVLHRRIDSDTRIHRSKFKQK